MSPDIAGILARPTALTDWHLESFAEQRQRASPIRHRTAERVVMPRVRAVLSPGWAIVRGKIRSFVRHECACVGQK